MARGLLDLYALEHRLRRDATGSLAVITLIPAPPDDWPPGLLRELYVTRIEPAFPQQNIREPDASALALLRVAVAVRADALDVD